MDLFLIWSDLWSRRRNGQPEHTADRNSIEMGEVRRRLPEPRPLPPPRQEINSDNGLAPAAEHDEYCMPIFALTNGGYLTIAGNGNSANRGPIMYDNEYYDTLPD